MIKTINKTLDQRFNLNKETVFTPRGSFVLIVLMLFFMMLFSLPKIFLSNNIYYISKDINQLYTHHMSLKEENKFLIQQLEDAKFKNQITDSLIMQNIEESDEKKD